MVTISAKEKWLIDAGLRLLKDSTATDAWTVWCAPQEFVILTGGMTVDLPWSIAQIAIRALFALATDLRLTLERASLPEQEEDELVNDLELTELASNVISRGMGGQEVRP